MYKVYTVKELLTLKNDTSPWIVPNMIPKQGRAYAYGVGGEFKTTVLLDLAIAVASGGRLLEQFPVTSFGPTLVISVESNIYANANRVLSHIRSRNLHPEMVQFYFGHTRLKLNTKAGLQELEAVVKKIRPVLLVLDPYVAFLEGDENSTQDAEKFTAAGDYLIEKYGLSVCVIHHSNKKGELRGSTVVQGWCDTVIRFSSTKGIKIPGIADPCRVVTVEAEKVRDGEEGKLFSAVPHFHKSPNMLTWGVHDGTDAQGVVIAYLKQQILMFLQRPGVGPQTKTALAEAFHVATDKIEIAIGWLMRDGFVFQTEIARPTSKDGERYRMVPAYAATGKLSRVDIARVMLDAEATVDAGNFVEELDPDVDEPFNS